MRSPMRCSRRRPDDRLPARPDAVLAADRRSPVGRGRLGDHLRQVPRGAGLRGGARRAAGGRRRRRRGSHGERAAAARAPSLRDPHGGGGGHRRAARRPRPDPGDRGREAAQGLGQRGAANGRDVPVVRGGGQADRRRGDAPRCHARRRRALRDHDAPARRRGRRDHADELAPEPRRAQGRAGAGRGERGRAQAPAGDPCLLAAPAPDPRRRRAAPGVPERARRPGGGRGPARAPGRRLLQLHRQRAGRRAPAAHRRAARQHPGAGR